MRTRQITLIGTLTGLGVLLLASLAVIYATRAQTVYAQDPPELSLSVSMGEVSLPQGGSTYIAATVHNLPRDANNQASLPELTYGRDLFRVLSDESTENANGCANGMGGNTPVNSVYANPKIVGSGWDNFTIKSDCPTGSYRVRMSVKHKDDSTDLVFGTKDFTVIPGPSVTIALSSDSFYRGTSSDVTMEFSYLNNMQDGSDLSYRADIIRRVTETTNNFADKCEGAGLGNIDKSDDSDSHLSNLGDSPSGAIEDQDGDGTVEVSGQIPTTCPTGRYKLTVELWDSSNSELTSTSIEFVVSTDPNATPSATVELSPPSPVTPGTEIDATISVYDLQDGADLKYRTDVIKRVNNADVVESSCHGDGIGLGQEFSFTVNWNPFVLTATISSNCPAGSYTLKSVITNGSGIEIVSGSADFTVGVIEANRAPVVTISTASARLEGGAMQVISGEATDPDSDSVEVSASTTGGALSAVTRSGDDWSVTLTAPAVTANPQTITVTISGEDPAGLTATASRAWTVGANVDPTVTIDQADMTVDGGASVDLSAVVAAPEAGQSVSTLWTATGGSYPDGDSGTTARWVAPAGGKTDTDYTLTATVEDALGATASDSIEVTVREDPNLRLIAPTVLNQTGTVGTAYTQTLDAWTGGVGRLRYTVTGQPGGLSFNEGTRTITGIPIEPVISEVTYTVIDNDGNGDEASTTFTITIIEANRVPVVTISTASARLEGGATQVISGEAIDPEGDSVEVSASTTGGALSAVTRSGDDWSVTLTAPAVTANPQTITVTISGEDPAGLTATASRAWTVGANVDPTVTIDQADMTVDGGASVDLSAVVAAPEAGQSVSTLWTATGGSYPDGDSGTTARWVAPAGGKTDTDYTLTATVEDALGATASDSIEVTVREDPNLRLIAPTVLNQTGTVGTAYTQTLDAWTGGVGRLRYTVTGQPGGLSFNEGTRTITGIPIEPVISEVTYTVIDNDGNGDEASTTFTITIIEANRVPVVTISTASARLEGGATQVISGEATDPEGDSVEVSASTTGGALSAVTRSGDDWSVTLTAPAVTANPQTITVTISGEDPAGLAATASRAWTVGANVDPTVTIDQADMTVDGGASVDLSAVVAAPEAGQSVSTLWTATGGSYPDGDSGTTVRWVAPASGQTDTGYTLTATAEDALGATASDSIEVTVRADPNATLFAPTVLNQNGRVGTPYTQTLDAWTGGVAPLRYTVTGQPGGLSFNEGTRTITGIPVEAGRSLVTYTVTDNDGNGDEASTTFTITVIEANRAPVVTISTASASLEGGAMQVISGEATDPDSDSVEVSASTTGGALSAVTRSGDDWSVTLTAPAVTANPQTITVTISGEDPAGLTATASRAWTVGANVDPTVTIDQADMTVDGGASVDLSAVVAAPEAGQSVSTLWTATGGSYSDGDSGTTARWVAPAGGKTDTDYTLTATVEDALGATASDSIEVTVREDPNLRLIAPTVLNQTGTVGTAYTQTLDAWTGGVGRLRYTVTGQPGGLSFNEGTRTITGIPIEPVISEVTYTVIDNDGNGDEASTTFTITIIEANRVPVVTISTASARLEGGATQVISGEATDPEGDSVEVSASTTGGALSAVTRSGDDWSVTLTAPAVTANPQTITVTISGEDPAGLAATASRAWTVGANVDPTVTIDQADMTVDGGASVDLSAVVAAPEAGQSVSTLWTATGGSYPDGDSGTTARWVAPASGQTDTGYTLTATAEDALGATASDSIEVTVRADPNATLFAPTVLNQNGRVGTPYTQTLDAWTGGVAPLRYTVTGQPDGLSFNEGTRTITGIPVEAGRSLVTYTVTDNDGNGDEASTTFTITVIEANRAPVVTISTASASLEGGAMQVISGAATDPDSDSVEVSASTTGGALSAVTRSGDDWSVTLTAPAATAITQTITVTISGEDPAGLTATASRAWTVGANVDSQEQNQQNPGNQGNQGNQQKRRSSSSQSSQPKSQSSPPPQQQSALPVAITQPILMNVRSGPGLYYEVITTVPQGTRATIIGIDPLDDWYQVEIVGVEGQVWIYQELTTLEGSLAAVKRFAQWEIALLPAFENEGDRPLAITQPILMNVRSGPGLDHDVVTTVPQGTRVKIIGIGPLDDWYQVVLDTLSTPPWIFQDLTTLVGSLAGVPQYTTLQSALLPVIATVDDRPLAIIQPILMNVRSGPGLDYDVVTTVPQGTRATIIGIGPLDDWYQVELDTLSTPAWIYQDLTTLVGSLAGVPRFTTLQTALLPVIETVDERPLAITQPILMNVRSGPGLDYDVVTTVAQGTRATIIGIGPLDDWYQVELDTLSTPAWIYQDLTTLVGSLAGVPRFTTLQTALLPVIEIVDDRPRAITQPPILYVREGPGTEYDVVFTVPQGTRAAIVGIGPLNEWYLVELDGLFGLDNRLAWIYQDLTILEGALVGVRQITAEEIALLPVAITLPEIMNARQGPGTEYEVSLVVPKGTWARITGIDAQNEWYLVEIDGLDSPTWIYRVLTNLVGSLAGVNQTAAGAYSPPATTPTTTTPPAATTPPAQSQPLSSITVDLSLPQSGGINLDVSWTDNGACAQAYNIYYRAGVDSSTYFSLQTAVTASTANTKSLAFSTLPNSGFISAWCGTNGAGRQIAEVQIDPLVAGTYSSLPPSNDAVAAAPQQ